MRAIVGISVREVKGTTLSSMLPTTIELDFCHNTDSLLIKTLLNALAGPGERKTQVRTKEIEISSAAI
jgi:hypothetical protein